MTLGRRGTYYYGLLATVLVFGAILLFADPAWAQTTIEATKDDSPDPVAEGEILTYTIEVENTGTTNDAEDVTVLDTLDPNTTFVSASPDCLPPVGPLVECELGDIAPGDTATVTIRVQPTAAAVAAGEVINNGTAEGTNTNLDSYQEITEVTPDLVITKGDSPGTVEVGDLLLYTLTVENEGTAPAIEVEVVDQLPDEVEFVSAEPSQGTCDEQPEGVVQCDLNNLAGGEDATVEIIAEAQEEGTITNTAGVFIEGVGEAIDEDQVTTTVEDNNNGNNNNGNNNRRPGFFPPFFDDPNDFFDEDEDDLEDAEAELDALDDEGETTTGEGTTGTDDGGAFAESGDPDEQPPVSGQRGDVVDEIDTGGQELPNTPGFPIIAVIIESIICATALVTFWALVVRNTRV